MALLSCAGAPAYAAETGCARAQPPGDRTVPLTSQGRSRPFLLHVPTGYTGTRRVALVLNLHGSDSNGPQQMTTSQLAPLADIKGFAVAAPQGAIRSGPESFSWNIPGVPLTSGSPIPPGTPDDERYLLSVIAAVKRTLCVDARRIYLTGHSGGGRMSSQMACDHAGVIAAIAPVAGLRAGVPRRTAGGGWEPDPATCKPARPVPVITFHGTGDTTNPYEGNDEPRWGYDVPTALKRWKTLDGCGTGRTTRNAYPRVDVIELSRCDGGARVKLYRRIGVPHTWAAGDVPVSELIWRFFAKQRLRASAPATATATAR